MKISIFLEDEDNGIVLKSFDNLSFENAEEEFYSIKRNYFRELDKADKEEEEEDEEYAEQAERDKQDYYDNTRI